MTRPETHTTAPANGILRQARKFIRKGYAILPLEPAKPTIAGSGKRPVTPHGVKDASTRMSVFKGHLAARPNLNLGIATGRTSGFLVVDVDPRNGGSKTMEKLCAQLGRLPPGPVVETGGGGRHRYFALPRGVEFNKTTLGDGVDVLGNNCYVVAPGSRHASGKDYIWRPDRSLDDMDPPPLPAKWQKALRQRVERQHGKTKCVPKDQSVKTTTPSYHEGSRNTSLTALAGSMRGRGLSSHEIENELLRVNRAECSPPLDEAEVKRIAASAGQWSTPPSTAGDAELIAQRVLVERFGGGDRIRFERGGEFYAFTGTHWQAMSDDALRKIIFDTVRDRFPQARKRLNSVSSEALAILRTELKAGDGDDPLHFVTAPPPVINTLSGEVWIKSDGTHELRPHRPETGCRHVLPVAYDPNATCPLYDRALGEIFSKAKHPDGLVAIWHEIAGYVIQTTRADAMIVILVGGGGNGKSKLVQTLTRLLGADAIYAAEISRLESSPFGIGSLVGKLLFLDDDVSSKTKLPDGILKKISEEKLVTGEKKHKDPFNFINRAVPMLLCNNVPHVTDLSPGIQRRLKVIRFDRSFQEGEDDRNLFPRIWNSELPGVLNRYLGGYARFVANGHRLSKSRDLERGCRDLLVQANPLATFIDDACVKDADGRVELNDLYDAHKIWAAANGYRFSIVRNQLKRDCSHLGFRVVTRNGYATVVGLRLKEPAS